MSLSLLSVELCRRNMWGLTTGIPEGVDGGACLFSAESLMQKSVRALGWLLQPAATCSKVNIVPAQLHGRAACLPALRPRAVTCCCVPPLSPHTLCVLTTTRCLQEHFFAMPEPGRMAARINWRINKPDGDFIERSVVQVGQHTRHNR